MNYEKYMKKCFKLALKAEGKTSPNPMVGCVLLDKDGNEIANGYHKACGEKHAEADALSKVDTADTLVVNLEPWLALWKNSTLCRFDYKKRRKKSCNCNERPKSNRFWKRDKKVQRCQY